jgi:hypothetical protein
MMASNRKSAIRQDDFIAEGPINTASDAVSIVAAFVTALYGLTKLESSEVKSHCQLITTFVATGNALATLGNALFFLLPFGVQKAIFQVSAPEHLCVQRELQEWNDKAVSLLRLKRIQHVLSSPEYRTIVESHIMAGTSLVSRMRSENAPMRGMIHSNLVQLQTIQPTLVNNAMKGGARDKPFGIHMSGPPGVGKTVCIRELIRQGLDMDQDKDSYSLNEGGDYWDGYVNQPIIVMDEWLTRQDADSRNDEASEYLSLMSTAPFQPPSPV